MLKKYTCIICPNGCEISAESEDGQILSIDGATCPRGREYVEQELTNPQRNIASSIRVEGGEIPLASVRLTKPIPKVRIFDVMAEIVKVCMIAPVKAGDVVIENVLSLNSDVIITKNVNTK
jgi:CxxC motif-containing protein